MMAIQVLLFLAVLDVVTYRFAVVFVVVDHVYQTANGLGEPDNHRVVHAQIPPRVYGDSRVMWIITDATLRIDLGELSDEIRTLYRLLKRFFRRARMLALHVIAKGFLFLGVPGTLVVIQLYAKLFFQPVEVLFQPGND